LSWLTSQFLVDREGNVVKRYFSTSEPAEIEKDIAALL
jgi:glutathione peroxidase-family protein